MTFLAVASGGGLWHWELRSDEGATLAVSEKGFASFEAVHRDIDQIISRLPNVRVERRAGLADQGYLSSSFI